MPLETYLSGVLVDTTSVLLGQRGYTSIPNAADGTGAQAGVIFDDPDGDMSVIGWQIVQTMETDCTSAPTLFYGSVYDRRYRRGPYSSGASREIDTTLNDANGFLHMRIVTGGDANRPEETDTARLAWLIGSNSLSGMVYDLGFVTGDGRMCDATNYRDMYPDEVLADIASPRNQIFFAYYDDAEEKVGLFFDDQGATTYTCTLGVSNVLSDVDDTTTFAPMIDGELLADPSDVYSGIKFKYTGGQVYRSRTDTAATFFPVPYELRSFVVENDKVGKLSTAIILADRILAADAQERFTLTFTVRLPSDKVGLVRPGMRIHCRFTHLPGFETGAYTRIQKLNYIPIDRRDFYDVAIECSTSGLTGAVPPGSGAGSTTPYPNNPPPSGAHYFESTVGFTTDGAGSSGGLSVVAPSVNHTTGVTGDVVFSGVAGVTYTYHMSLVVDPADLDTGHEVGLAEDDGTAVWGPLHIAETAPSTVVTWDGTVTLVSAFSGYLTAQVAAGSHVPKAATLYGYIDPDGWSPSTPEAPNPGTPVEDETPSPDPDGSTTEFTTAFPYAVKSLHVTMSGVELDADVDFTETTSTTFTFTDPPPTDAQIVVWYITGA